MKKIVLTLILLVSVGFSKDGIYKCDKFNQYTKSEYTLIKIDGNFWDSKESNSDEWNLEFTKTIEYNEDNSNYIEEDKNNGYKLISSLLSGRMIHPYATFKIHKKNIIEVTSKEGKVFICSKYKDL